MSHVFPIRVYYEDTDLAGIVYYANYLKFIERGRSEMVRALGLDQDALRRTQGVVFAVRRVEADYLKPARFDDLIHVETQVEKLTGARLFMDQRVVRGDEVLFTAKVVLVCIDAAGAPQRLTADIRRMFEKALA